MIDVRNLGVYLNKGDCFAITSYCTSPDRLDILDKTIKNIRQYGLPILLHAHYPVPDEFQKKVDFYFYSSDNPIFNRYNKFWGFTDGYELFAERNELSKGYQMEITEYDHYYTALKGWDESIKILSNYNRIHMINYDSNIYPELFEFSKKTDKSVFLQHRYFGPRNKDHIFLLYFCLNKKSYEYFRENITVEKYVGFWAKVNTKFLPAPEELVATFIKNDENFYVIPHTDINFDKLLEYDINTDARIYWDKLGHLDNTKIFIGEYNGLVNVLFYGLKKPIKINITTFHRPPVLQEGTEMGGDIGGNISSHSMVSLHFPFSELEKIIIKIDDKPVSDDLIKKFIRLESKIYLI